MPVTANEFVEQQLDERVKELENTLNSDVLTIIGDVVGGVDDFIRSVVEEKRQKSSDRNKLTVILTTLGGYIEIVQRIVETLRYHYKIVDFLIPNYAYSAGTVLAISGDAIHMDYYSRLGPIDPQVQTESGRAVPALGYIIQYERLIQKAIDGTITLPEVQLMIQKFDQAELYQFEQARELSISLLEEWLAKYKFKNWRKTETRGIRVTPSMRKARAKEIAEELNKTEKWHVHGYGISMEVLKRDLKLRIDDFGQDPHLSNLVKEYNSLLTDYMQKTGQQGVIHAIGLYRPFVT